MPNPLTVIAMSALLFGTSTSTALQIGAWVGGPATETYPQPTEANVTAFETMQGRKLDLISEFVLWDSNDWAWTQTYADIAAAHNATLVVTWMANGYSAQNIVDGAGDDYIRQYASDVKAYGKEVWLRPLHEANGNWYTWGVGTSGAGNTNANVIAAWQHIVQIFRDSNVTNVKWVWTTNATNSGTGTSIMGAYPGDAWVDYNSIDGYNWGTAQTWSSWQTFTAIMKPAYTLLAAHDKPIFIAEFSSSEQGGNKAQWITDMFAALPVTFPKIFALMWFSQTKSAEADWAVNTSDASLAAWKAGIAAASTIVRNTPSPASTFWSVSNAELILHLDRASNVEITLVDLAGRIRYSAKYSTLGAGEHHLPLPNKHPAWRLQVSVQ